MRLLGFLALFPTLLIGQDAGELMRRAIEIDRSRLEASREYSFVQRQEVRQVDGSGTARSTDNRTFEVVLLDGSPYRRLVARNDKPLSPQEQKFEQDRLERALADRRKEPPEQRARRVAEWRQKQEHQREPVKEFPQAFAFRLAGEENRGGEAVWVIDATPKPGYKPKSTTTSFFPKVKVRFWLRKQDCQWVRLEMETMDTISFGGILLRLSKGSHMVMEQVRVGDDVWAPKTVSVDALGRILLVKGMHREYLWDFSAYRKTPTEPSGE